MLSRDLAAYRWKSHPGDAAMSTTYGAKDWDLPPHRQAPHPASSTDVGVRHLYFEDAEIGAVFTAGPRLVTKDEIILFATQYDPVPRHIDEEAAARSIFGGLTASSAHTFSIFVLLTTRLQPRLRVLAGLDWNGLRLPYAVRPGDQLDLETKVLEMRESKSKPDRG